MHVQSLPELLRMTDDHILRAPDEPICVVACTGCGDEMYEGDEATEYDGEIFCSEECLAGYLIKQGHATHVWLESPNGGGL